MKLKRVVRLAALIAIVGLFTSTIQADDEAYKLPEKADAAVITLDYPGGQIQRVSDEPVLEIRANGVVILGNPWGQSERIETKISAEELQQLLKEILKTHEFFELDSAKMKAAVQASQAGGLRFSVADGATTVVRVETADKQHELKYYVLRMDAQKYPDIKSLQHLRAIEELLSHRMHLIRAGGPEGVAEKLKIANEALAKEFPDAKPFTADDLAFAYKYARGNQRISFARTKKNDAGRDQTTVAVNITYAVDSKTPEVSVRGKP